MNIVILKNAIGLLDKLLSKAKDALWDVEREVFGHQAYGNGGGYEYPRAAMAAFLDELHDILSVILEAAEMPQTRARLIEAWSKFKGGKGLKHTNENDALEFCESPALTFLEHMIEGLRATVSETISSEEAWTLSRLEAMLRDTAALVHRRDAPPANEIELQHIMHDYLSACFPDFQFNPQIGGTLKNFKPDCGIASVKAAIEIKFVQSQDQIAPAFSGVAEDTAGYKGSKDWTRFYAVIYQAEPFMLESHLRSDMKRIGAATWTPIVVNGPTKNTKSRQKKIVGKSKVSRTRKAPSKKKSGRKTKGRKKRT